MNNQSVALPLSLALLMLAGCIEDTEGPPQYGLFLTVGVVAKVQGRFSPQDPGDSSVALIRPFIAGPALMPDYLDHPAPPLCMGFTFGATKPPNIVSGDAGTLRIDGLPAVGYRDLTMGPMPGPAMTSPDVFDCERITVGDTSPYACPMPAAALLDPGAQWLEPETPVAFSILGGTEVGAFSEAEFAPVATATTAGGFSLHAVNPRQGVTAQWEAPNADMVMIELIGQLADGSVGAQVLCIAPAEDGSKVLPKEALALMPEPTNPMIPLVIQTNLVGLTARTGYVGWANYLFAAGHGHFGLSIVGPQ